MHCAHMLLLSLTACGDTLSRRRWGSWNSCVIKSQVATVRLFWQTVAVYVVSEEEESII